MKCCGTGRKAAVPRIPTAEQDFQLAMADLVVWSAGRNGIKTPRITPKDIGIVVTAAVGVNGLSSTLD
jgi:hypothetical protein